MPRIAFGFIYGPGLNITLNDPSYMTYLFETVSAEYTDGAVTTKKQPINLLSNCQPSWLGSYNNVYQNLTCVTSNLQIMNPPLKRLNSITQRITINTCNPSTSSVTCQNNVEIAKMMAGGRIIMIVN